MKTVFTSNFSVSDAEMKAKMAGYKVISSTRNQKGQYVVFARR